MDTQELSSHVAMLVKAITKLNTMTCFDALEPAALLPCCHGALESLKNRYQKTQHQFNEAEVNLKEINIKTEKLSRETENYINQISVLKLERKLSKICLNSIQLGDKGAENDEFVSVNYDQLKKLQNTLKQKKSIATAFKHLISHITANSQRENQSENLEFLRRSNVKFDGEVRLLRSFGEKVENFLPKYFSDSESQQVNDTLIQLLCDELERLYRVRAINGQFVLRELRKTLHDKTQN